eukprot:1397126-Pleurochrysis_carterae.AAC.1
MPAHLVTSCWTPASPTSAALHFPKRPRRRKTCPSRMPRWQNVKCSQCAGCSLSQLTSSNPASSTCSAYCARWSSCSSVRSDDWGC